MAVVEDVGTQYKHFFKKTVCIDNIVFRLHYRVVLGVLLAFFALVSSRYFISEYITCLADYTLEQVVESFCYIHSTFTVRKYHDKAYRKYVPHSGVGPHAPRDELIHHSYYPWVPFMLAFQAFLFYTPHGIWKRIGAYRLIRIITHVNRIPVADNGVSISATEYLSQETKDNIVYYLKEKCLSSVKYNSNRCWALSLTLCELLNLANLTLQMYLIDWFINGHFFTLGLQNDVSEAFPKVTKCTLYTYGPSGNIINHDALCILPMNLYHEMVYTFVWFVFSCLFVLTSAGLLWRVTTLFLVPRTVLLTKFLSGHQVPGSERLKLELIAKKVSSYDWLFFRYLGKNMDACLFRSVLQEIISSLAQPLLLKHVKSEIPTLKVR